MNKADVRYTAGLVLIALIAVWMYCENGRRQERQEPPKQEKHWIYVQEYPEQLRVE